MNASRINYFKFNLGRFFVDKKLDTILEYPWCLSTKAPQSKIPSFWDIAKQKHLLKVGETHIIKLFKDGYRFPYEFIDDSSAILEETFKILSGGADEVLIKKVMIEELAEKYIDASVKLNEKEQRIEFVLHTLPKISIKSYRLIYGPFPVPEKCVSQEWHDFMSIIIPDEEAEFQSHAHQKEIIKKAADQGCFIRIDTVVHCDLELILSHRNGLPLLRDRRKEFKVSFTSPHFNPWDDIYNLQEDGSWKLNWNWKIIAIDQDEII